MLFIFNFSSKFNAFFFSTNRFIWPGKKGPPPLQTWMTHMKTPFIETCFKLNWVS